MRECVYVCACEFVRTYVCLCICACAYVCVYMCVYLCACVCVGVCVCACIYIGGGANPFALSPVLLKPGLQGFIYLALGEKIQVVPGRVT